MSSATSGNAPTIRLSVFLATLVASVLGIVALLMIDHALARADRAASQARAAAWYRRGNLLLANGHAREATERFATALATQRDSSVYAIALARALILADRRAEAERVLVRVLSTQGSDGAANRLMADLLYADGRAEDAKAFYHRAVYGSWRADSLHQRASARLALVELLATRRDSAELLAELLPLEAEFTDSLPLRYRLAQLFVRGGLPQRGAAIYQQLVRRNPRDREAHEGLAMAAFDMGSFRSSRASLLEALRLDPADSATANRLRLVDTVIAWNPYDRAADAHERYRRSGVVAQRTLESMRRCAVHADSETALVDSLEASLKRTIPRRDEPDASELRLRLASRWWSFRPTDCPRTATDSALDALHMASAR